MELACMLFLYQNLLPLPILKLLGYCYCSKNFQNVFDGTNNIQNVVNGTDKTTPLCFLYQECVSTLEKHKMKLCDFALHLKEL